MSVLRLALPTPLRRLFDYLPPEGCDIDNLPALQPGVRVRVPFGNRELIGLLVETDLHSDVPGYKLKPALEILDQQPPLPDHLFALARWAAGYYHHPEGDALHQALPVMLRKGAPCQYAHATLWRATEHASLDALSARAKRQRETLAIVLAQQTGPSHSGGLSSDAIRAEGGDSQALKTLAEKGLVESFEYIPSSHQPQSDSHAQLLREPALPL
ncbi:MAG: primosomal protein N', partial [Porticoccaceae bacterium]|nr:primosomal protein N' [Porticoccaceae bacterium]